MVADGQIFCAIDTSEIELGHCVERLGEHIWLFSTDYPHSRNPWPDGVPQITERTDLSESAKIAMLGGNAKRFCPRLG
jgi:predicted TIM-barrel fold metal-dependent hydrolase